MRKLLFGIGMLTMLILINTEVSGQGITTASINGTLTSAEGEVLPGCVIVVIHKPTGSNYVTTSGAKGDYVLPDLKVGGPYYIKVSMLGYKDQIDSTIYLDLGEDLNLNYKLSSNSTNLNQVVISGKTDNTFNSGRTGSNTNISSKDLQMLPSISRSLTDYTRLAPEANGWSFAGANNRYNNFAIDGSVNNDVFGLAGSGTNGGQAGTQPISLDAIQTVNIAISPYDVKQGGFTGAGINAVTKSGANNIFGDVYFFDNNQNFVGKSVIDGSKANNYSNQQMGVSLGGPIIKDKLFYFINGEETNRSTPSTYNIGGGSAIPDSIMENIEKVLAKVSDGTYSGGGYGPYTNKASSEKLFARVDWNINSNNKLTIRNNYVQASEDILSRSINSLTINDGGYTMKDVTNNTVMEFDSRFSNKMSNELRIGYTTVYDHRVVPNDAFPYIKISVTPQQSVFLGTDYLSMANSLKQNITTLSDNLSIYLNKNKITIGTEDELYHFKNLFIQDEHGYYTYSTYSSFMDITSSPAHQVANWDCANYNYYYSIVPGQPNWAAQFSAMQLGAYAQDEISFIKNLKITAGVRVDVPVFPDKPDANNTFDTSALAKTYNLATTQMPKSNPLISPRLGFNWDVNGKHSTQIRGGTGIFTGRIPFVWLSNQYSNTGTDIARISDLTKPVAFNPDPNNQITTVNSLHLPIATTEVDVVSKNFKFAQNFRTNLAIDQKLPLGIKATVEGIYTKKINDIAYQDLTMEPMTNLTGTDNRPVYPITTPPRVPALTKYYTHIMYLSNTNQGYSYTLTGKLQKDFKFGLGVSGSYTYGQSFSTNDATSSVALSNWQYNYNYMGTNTPELAPSSFALGSRCVGVVTYKIKYANHCTTSLGIFYNGQSGTPYSYCYSGSDINNDGGSYNSLMFVPAKAADIDLIPNGSVSPATEWQELNNYIQNDSYLKTRIGKYAERNGARTPFENHFDLRVAQNFYLTAGSKKHELEVNFDILNFTNLLNSKWGRAYSISYGECELVSFAGYNGSTPTFTYTPPKTSTPWQISDLASRWQAQIGIKYSFD
jgi:hypothetical protein